MKKKIISKPGQLDDRRQPITLGQRLRERAQRLYMMGELQMAAQLLLELAPARHPEQAEGLSEPIRG